MSARYNAILQVMSEGKSADTTDRVRTMLEEIDESLAERIIVLQQGNRLRLYDVTSGECDLVRQCLSMVIHRVCPVAATLYEEYTNLAEVVGEEFHPPLPLSVKDKEEISKWKRMKRG